MEPVKTLEGIVLTGGASRRMGTDKASLSIDGEPLGLRIAKLLATRCERVTVLGRSSIDGFGFLADETDFAGPLAALSRFSPESDYVFVASCDLVRFEPQLIDGLFLLMGDKQAAVPVLQGREQPLCALYRASAFGVAAHLASKGERRIMSWVSALEARKLNAEELPHGFACTNVNSQLELDNVLQSGEKVGKRPVRFIPREELAQALIDGALTPGGIEDAKQGIRELGLDPANYVPQANREQI